MRKGETMTAAGKFAETEMGGQLSDRDVTRTYRRMTQIPCVRAGAVLSLGVNAYTLFYIVGANMVTKKRLNIQQTGKTPLMRLLYVMRV